MEIQGFSQFVKAHKAAMTKITITMGTHVTEKWQHTTKWRQ